MATWLVSTALKGSNNHGQKWHAARAVGDVISRVHISSKNVGHMTLQAMMLLMVMLTWKAFSRVCKRFFLQKMMKKKKLPMLLKIINDVIISVAKIAGVNEILSIMIDTRALYSSTSSSQRLKSNYESTISTIKDSHSRLYYKTSNTEIVTWKFSQETVPTHISKY